MLRIYLTGELCLWHGHRLVAADRLPGRQGRLTFAYLTSERLRPIPRDELAEVIWPSQPPVAYGIALSAVISKLRSLLVDLGLPRRVLASADGCYHVSLPQDVWIDTEVAVEAAHLAEEAWRSGDPRKAYGPAVVAAAILRRPFLPGADGEWVDARRQILQRANLRALGVLAELHSWNSEAALAVRAAEEMIALEPFRESGYGLLMRIHQRNGDRAEALRVYERCRRLLADELGERPGPAIEAVRAEIAGEATAAKRPPAQSSASHEEGRGSRAPR